MYSEKLSQSKDNMTEQPNRCKKRFKGIENFLRRVAFNLGNTPSQTEVKIISCIPIDVTDLQQKIIQLERQLEEDRTQVRGSAVDSLPGAEQPKKVRQASVHTAIGAPVLVTPKSIKSFKGVDYNSQPMEGTYRKRSLVSFIFPNRSNSHQELNNISREQLDMFEECCYEQNEQQKNFFQRKKKPSNKKKVRTQLVYYTQTDNSPFNRYVPSLKPIPDNEMLSRSYLSNMVRKQYKPIPIDGFSDFSHFTAPVCRDTDTDYKPLRSFDSDACSCCHGAFHNIDTHMTHNTNVPPPFYPTAVKDNNNNSNAYYDSSLYDLVPVKEKPCKLKRDPEYKRKENKRDGISKYRSEYMRTKTGVHPLSVNYHTMAPNYIKKKQTKIHHRRDAIVNRARKQKYKNTLDRATSIETSKSCCVDLGEIYIKPVKTKTQAVRKIGPLRKNAECLTTSVTKIECQTATSDSIEVKPTPQEDKTEVTLNQIKTILQSVLTEVKTNSQAKNVTEIKNKKDAVVQKGVSQSNMQGASSLMNSFSYSPYNMNPYIASCSRNLPSNQLFYNGYNGLQHPKCLQNYPLFIQTPGRHMCASCYRNSSHISKPVHPKYATTAANTEEICGGRTKETEKLIKEIYKSMALTMDLAAKDTSLSEYDDLKSTQKDSTDKSISKPNNQRVMKKVPDAVSELIRNKDTTHTTYQLAPHLKPKSKTPSTPSRRSREMSTDTVVTNNKRKEIIEKFHNNKEIVQSTETEYEAHDLQQPSTMTSISDDETETSSSGTESDDTYVPAKETGKAKKEKKGIFSKFKSVFKSKEKKRKPESEAEESEVSDSDDYQTIYSQKVERIPKRVPTARKAKPHSKVMHTKQCYQRDRKPEKSKRTPYMEQEYRRYWNEKLMFHENQRRRFSSEQPFIRENNPRVRPRPEYYRNYEARSVLVEPRGQMYHPRVGPMNRNPPQPRIEHPQQSFPESKNITVPRAATEKGLAWLKKHKMGVRCGEQWKKFLLES